MERKGKVYALPVQSAGSKTVLPILKSKVNDGATNIHRRVWWLQTVWCRL
jgi:transposase-like protein